MSERGDANKKPTLLQEGRDFSNLSKLNARARNRDAPAANPTPPPVKPAPSPPPKPPAAGPKE